MRTNQTVVNKTYGWSVPMKCSEIAEALTGDWAGSKRLYLSWLPNPEHTSASSLTIRPAAGKFLTFAYTWSHEGTPQEGLLLLGLDEKGRGATAAWADSWHMSPKLMACAGSVEDSGEILLRGSFEAPPGPDWGWRIAIATTPEGRLRIVMHNVSPEGVEDLAVDAEYEHAA